MKRTFLFCSLFLLALGIITFTRIKANREQRATATAFREAQNELTKAESAKLYAVGAHLQATQTLTDDELDYALEMLERGNQRRKEGKMSFLTMKALTNLSGKKKLTPEQREKLVATVLPLTQDPPKEKQWVENGIPSSEISIQKTAMVVLAWESHPEVSTQLHNLAQHSAVEEVRTYAKLLLAKRQSRKIS